MAQSKEERAAYMAVYRAKNKEKRAAYDKKYREENKDRRAATKKKWGAKNKDEVATYQREYLQTPKGRFVQHKNRAKGRGIEFLFTFAEWWEVWEPHWEQRGGLGHELCMCRTGDEGAYEVGNVRIDTMANNVKEMQSGKMYRQDTT